MHEDSYRPRVALLDVFSYTLLAGVVAIEAAKRAGLVDTMGPMPENKRGGLDTQSLRYHAIVDVFGATLQPSRPHLV